MMSVRRADVGVRCGGWRPVRRGDSASVRGGAGADGAGIEALRRISPDSLQKREPTGLTDRLHEGCRGIRGVWMIPRTRKTQVP